MLDMQNRYVNFYQTPGSGVKTSSIHNSKEEADRVWNSRWDNVHPQHQTSTKQRIACIRVSAVCVAGQFDL